MKREAGRERERKRQTDEDQDCESMKQHYSKESQVKACTHTHREIKRQIHGFGSLKVFTQLPPSAN